MNLIITCARHCELETTEEIKCVLEMLGDSNAIISNTEMSGILTAITCIDPIIVVEKMREMILEEPWCIRYCLRIIPIQKTTSTNILEMSKIVSCMSTNIASNETYKIAIKKRNSNISSKEIISEIANNINNKVSLTFPDKIIMIEIFGNKTGISILKQSEILSVEKTKLSISD